MEKYNKTKKQSKVKEAKSNKQVYMAL